MKTDEIAIEEIVTPAPKAESTPGIVLSLLADLNIRNGPHTYLENRALLTNRENHVPLTSKGNHVLLRNQGNKENRASSTCSTGTKRTTGTQEAKRTQRTKGTTRNLRKAESNESLANHKTTATTRPAA